MEHHVRWDIQLFGMFKKKEPPPPATSEVLITPAGNNVFDDFGKKALFWRRCMFMDAQDPKVVHIERKSAQNAEG
jgi:hypothetical protein